MHHIFIATPCYGGMVTQSYMQSIIGCMAESEASGFRLTLSMLGDDALITRARNTLLHQFFAHSDASHILFIDSDIGFHARDIATLLATDKPVIGAAYPLKAHYWNDRTIALLQRGEPPETACLRYVGECVALDDAGTEALVPVAYVGTGFLLIRREVVAKMIKAYPQTRYRRIDAPDAPSEQFFALFDCMIDPETQTYLSEDFAFCQRWRSLGNTVWLHRGIQISHTGPTSFSGSLLYRAGL